VVLQRLLGTLVLGALPGAALIVAALVVPCSTLLEMLRCCPGAAMQRWCCEYRRKVRLMVSWPTVGMHDGVHSEHVEVVSFCI
jgi:hypothetical protein